MVLAPEECLLWLESRSKPTWRSILFRTVGSLIIFKSLSQNHIFYINHREYSYLELDQLVCFEGGAAFGTLMVDVLGSRLALYRRSEKEYPFSKKKKTTRLSKNYFAIFCLPRNFIILRITKKIRLPLSKNNLFHFLENSFTLFVYFLRKFLFSFSREIYCFLF